MNGATSPQLEEADLFALMRLAYYPFLPHVRAIVRKTGISVPELLEAPHHAASRHRAVERLESALSGVAVPTRVLTSKNDGLVEALSFPIARMAIASIADKTLLRRYAESEAKHLQAIMQERVKTFPLETIAVARELGIPLHDPEVDGYDLTRLVYEETLGRPREYWVGFADYFGIFAQTETKWKLIQRVLDKGRVQVEATEVVQLCAKSLEKRIGEELAKELGRPLDPAALEGLEQLLAPLEAKLDAARESWTTGDFGPVQPDLFPPCVKEVFEALKRKENVPHHGRFALATFLNTIGWGPEQILDYLSATPNFDREKSRYQIEHVTGQKGVQAYTPPGCATMQTNGVCPLAKRDSVCFTIKHPLAYYRKQLRRQQWFAQRAAAAAAPPTTQTAERAEPAEKPVSAVSAGSAVSSGAKP